MPLVAHTNLPTFERLRLEGQTVLEPNRAQQQDIRELHIGLLNMMPDAALAATERQFYRLVGESNQIAQFHIHPFTLKELARNKEGQDHVSRYYEPVEKVMEEGLDALIITGANVTHPNLSAEPFWNPLNALIDWATANVTSVLCSCLATHAVMQFRYGKARKAMGAKRWGVYSHRVIQQHPLVSGVNTIFDVPHSRFNNISREQFEDAGLHVLVESEEAGVHMAVSEDGFRTVFFQGHPEYDTISLLKEYKREAGRYIRGERPDYPPFPEHYFTIRNEAILEEYQDRMDQARRLGDELPEFPEALLVDTLNNTWHDTAEAVISNWIGKVYQITHRDRKLPFMDGVDPQNPLANCQT